MEESKPKRICLSIEEIERRLMYGEEFLTQMYINRMFAKGKHTRRLFDEMMAPGLIRVNALREVLFMGPFNVGRQAEIEIRDNPGKYDYLR